MFEHILHVKELTISLLLDKLEYANEQYLRCFCYNVEVIDENISINYNTLIYWVPLLE